MNQLLALSHQAAMSEDFFRYYWLSVPNHTFDIRAIPFFDETYDGASAILSLDQLVWGLHRIYMDCLLYFGTIRIGYRELRHKSWAQLIGLFDSHKFNTEQLRHRGPYLPLNEIARDDRYLISEQACKTLDHPTTGRQELDDMLHGALISAQSKGANSSKVRDLINPDNLEDRLQSGEQRRMLFVTDEILDREVKSKEELIAAINELQNAFHGARSKALKNTELYLSMANDLDVYVATSMRSREDFRAMAKFCETVFASPELKDLNLRYFDPTLSAAQGHEDKGLIECLMVKCSKLLIYTAGKSDSYGKDAEAAMALTLGKPVIFYCDETHRRDFFTDIHPLSRLIAFNTGVAVGVMAVSKPEDVIRLVERIFYNKLRFKLQRSTSGHLRLVEEISECTVRVQTSDLLLRETFWNCYHPSGHA